MSIRRTLLGVLCFALMTCVMAEAQENPFGCPDPPEFCSYGTHRGCLDHCDRAFENGDLTATQWYCCKSSDCEACPHMGGAASGSQGDTPILIDLGEHGLELTSSSGGVSFDLDADGVPESLAWTAAGAADAFLALDRDGDGAITSGAELFGDASPQPPSPFPNGFAALAVFDQLAAGGNGDGLIGPADLIWRSLLLWTDSSHDGVSQPSELRPISASGLSAILLDVKVSGRRDQHGNVYRYRSSALTQGGNRRIDVFDVIFATR